MSAAKPRTCGGCTACCRALAIPELDKPSATPCRHEQPALAGRPAGCGIYATRPETCRGFRCLWLAGALPQGERPDRSGLIASAGRKNDGRPFVFVREAVAGALETPRGRRVLRRAREATGLEVVGVPAALRPPDGPAAWIARGNMRALEPGIWIADARKAGTDPRTAAAGVTLPELEPREAGEDLEP